MAYFPLTYQVNHTLKVMPDRQLIKTIMDKLQSPSQTFISGNTSDYLLARLALVTMRNNSGENEKYKLLSEAIISIFFLSTICHFVVRGQAILS